MRQRPGLAFGKIVRERKQPRLQFTLLLGLRVRVIFVAGNDLQRDRRLVCQKFRWLEFRAVFVAQKSDDFLRYRRPVLCGFGSKAYQAARARRRPRRRVGAQLIRHGIGLAPAIGAHIAFHHFSGMRRFEQRASGAHLDALRAILIRGLLLGELFARGARLRSRDEHGVQRTAERKPNKTPSRFQPESPPLRPAPLDSRAKEHYRFCAAALKTTTHRRIT
jgi:hypothetical protein